MISHEQVIEAFGALLLMFTLYTMNGFRISLNKLNSRVDKVEADIASVKENYISRFEAIIKLITESNACNASQHSEIKELINKLFADADKRISLHEERSNSTDAKLETIEQQLSKRRKAG